MTSGRMIGRYLIIDRISAGGQATVYRARDTGSKATVALKVLEADSAKDRVTLGRFLNEARLAAKVVHPNVVRIHEVGQEGDDFFIAMEFVPNCLIEVMRGQPQMPEDDVVEIAKQMASALEAARREGVVHRDVKPSNVLITDRGVAMLTDFGIARALEDDGLTKVGRTVGTERYMAPEQRQGRADTRSDVYALGVMMFEMLTGDIPPADKPFVREARPDVSASLDKIVRKCIEREPRRRYQTPQELLDALQKEFPVTEEIPVDNPPIEPPAPPPGPPDPPIEFPPPWDRRKQLTDAAQHPLAQLALTPAPLMGIYELVLDGLGDLPVVPNPVSILVIALSCFAWMYTTLRVYEVGHDRWSAAVARAEALAREREVRHLANEPDRALESIQQGFREVASAEGLSRLAHLREEYEHTSPVLDDAYNRGLVTSPLVYEGRHAFLQGIDVMRDALNLARAIHLSHPERLRQDLAHLTEEVTLLSRRNPDDPLIPLREKEAETIRESLRAIDGKSLQVAKLFSECAMLEASLRNTRLAAAGLTAISAGLTADTIRENLRAAIRQAEEVREELKRLGILPASNP